METAQDYAPIKHSKLTAPNPFTMERTPVKGEPNPIYGYIMDGGKRMPIVLTSGSTRRTTSKTVFRVKTACKAQQIKYLCPMTKSYLKTLSINA